MATTAKEAHREWEINKAITEQPIGTVESLFLKHSQAAYMTSAENIGASARSLIGNLNLAIKEQEKINDLATDLNMRAYEAQYKNRITNYQKILQIVTIAIREAQTLMGDQ